jgi:membrane-bound ClpP family serine protease
MTNQRPFLHVGLGLTAGAAAAWTLTQAEPRFSKLGLLFIACALGEGAWALGGLANQRHDTRQPRRPFVNELMGMVGAEGVVIKACSPRGQVRIAGEVWQAEALHVVTIPEGSVVRVISARSLVLGVDPSQASKHVV